MKLFYFPSCLKLMLTALSFICLKASAQSTTPTPYCYPTASNMISGSCTGNFGYSISSVELNTLSKSAGCYGTGNTDVYRYWSNTTTLLAGQMYKMEIVSPKGAYSANVYAGFWIDYNQNNTFDSVELIGTGSGMNGQSSVKYTINFTVPCSATAGITRMRVRVQGASLTGNQACAAGSGSGETWDFDITITQPSSVNTGFTSKDTVYVKTKVNFTNTAGQGYIQHVWDANNDGTPEQTNKSDFAYIWNSTGTKCVKLKSTNCFGFDTFIKCITVIAPAAIPVPSFSGCQRVVQQYEAVQLFDESTNGPWQWTWNIYDSSQLISGWYPSLATGEVYADPWGTGNNEFSQNPEFAFDVPGYYTVVLTVRNDIGQSQTFVKKNFIKVTLPTQYNLGYGTYGPNNDNVVHSNTGTIFDDGGPNLNYGNNQGKSTRSFLAIEPANVSPITLKFHQVRLADTDTLKIYDEDRDDPSKLLATLTIANNGTYPTITSTNNAMYLLFKTNGSGTDSGYSAEYYTAGYGGSQGSKVDIGHGLMLANKQIKLYVKYPSKVNENAYTRWKVDGVLKNQYSGLDTLKHTFSDTTNHTVCVEVISCDTTYTVCKRLIFDKGIIGNTYKDMNANCSLDNSDLEINNITVKVRDTGNNIIAQYSTSGGEYSFDLPPGQYKVYADSTRKPIKSICPYPGLDTIVTLTNSVTMAQNVNFAIQCKNNFDIGAQSVVVRGRVFPGQPHSISVLAGDLSNWYGLKCAVGISGTVKITVNGPVIYTGKAGGSLTPSVSGNVFTYSISDFASVNIRSDFGLMFTTDTTAQSGDTITVDVEVTPVSGDGDTTNNRKRMFYLALNSYDPNMKEVYPVDVPPFYNDWFTYTIHFQNTGNAEAYNIRLADTLDQQLDLSTFEVLNYSHTMSSSVKGNAVSFKFPNIMLPDSFSDEKGSHGFVQYRIKPKNGLTEGAKIRNTAYIYFDYNKPVVTNTTVNEYVDKMNSIRKLHGSNLMKVYPNPNNGSFNIELASRFDKVPCNLEICNVLGEVVYSTVIRNAAARIDISTFAPGVYLIKVNGNGALMSANVIKY